MHSAPALPKGAQTQCADTADDAPGYDGKSIWQERRRVAQYHGLAVYKSCEPDMVPGL